MLATLKAPWIRDLAASSVLLSRTPTNLDKTKVGPRRSARCAQPRRPMSSYKMAVTAVHEWVALTRSGPRSRLDEPWAALRSSDLLGADGSHGVTLPSRRPLGHAAKHAWTVGRNFQGRCKRLNCPNGPLPEEASHSTCPSNSPLCLRARATSERKILTSDRREGRAFSQATPLEPR